MCLVSLHIVKQRRNESQNNLRIGTQLLSETLHTLYSHVLAYQLWQWRSQRNQLGFFRVFRGSLGIITQGYSEMIWELFRVFPYVNDIVPS